MVDVWLVGESVVAAIAAHLVSRSIQGRRTAALQRTETWGQSVVADRDSDQVMRYDAMVGSAPGALARSRVTDRVWRDLSMDDLFAELDRTSSVVGRQVLYHRLRTPATTQAELSAPGAFEREISGFADDPAHRERVQRILARLDDSAAYALPRLFMGEIPAKPKGSRFYPLLGIAALLAIVAGLSGIAHAWSIALAVLVVNFVIRNVVASDVAWLVHPFRALRTLIDVADELAAEGTLDRTVTSSMLASVQRLRRMTGLITLVGGGSNEFVRALFDYGNMLFLVDINGFVHAMNEMERRRHEIGVLFQLVGTVDAAIAVASFRHGRRFWCRPVIRPSGRGLEVSNIVHPLVSHEVGNDVMIDAGAGIVVTGANMSGKTTLIRRSAPT